MSAPPYRTAAPMPPPTRAPWWRRALCAAGLHRWRYVVRGESWECSRVACDGCAREAPPWEVLRPEHDLVATRYASAPRCACAGCVWERELYAMASDE